MLNLNFITNLIALEILFYSTILLIKNLYKIISIFLFLKTCKLFLKIIFYFLSFALYATLRLIKLFIIIIIIKKYIWSKETIFQVQSNKPKQISN